MDTADRAHGNRYFDKQVYRTRTCCIGLPARPNSRCYNLKLGQRPAWGEIQGAKVRSAEGEVANYFRHAGGADDLAGWRDHPDAAGADAKYAAFGVDFHTVGDAGRR